MLEVDESEAKISSKLFAVKSPESAFYEWSTFEYLSKNAIILRDLKNESTRSITNQIKTITDIIEYTSGGIERFISFIQIREQDIWGLMSKSNRNKMRKQMQEEESNSLTNITKKTFNLPHIKYRYLKPSIVLRFLLTRQILIGNLKDNQDEIQAIKYLIWHDGSSCLGWLNRCII